MTNDRNLFRLSTFRLFTAVSGACLLIAVGLVAIAGGQTGPQEDDLFVPSTTPDTSSGSPSKPSNTNNAVAAKLVGERPYKLLYPDRTPKFVTRVKLFSDDSRVYHGPFVEYYRGGKEFCRGQYRDGRREGEWVFHHRDGSEAKKGTYTDGKPSGKWTYLHQDGRNLRLESYKDGLPHGIWVYYDRDGKTPASQIEFADGKFVSNESS